MKRIAIITVLSAILLSACGGNEDKSADTGDTTLVPESQSVKEVDPIIGRISQNGTAKLGQPINIKFSVYNNSDSTVKFCKWHTPFEKLISKYLDVAMEDFTPVDYKGAMAKRVMPPPADSYTTLKKGDSTTVTFDLNEGYNINKAGSYTIKYNASNISGIVVKDSLKISVSN